MNAVETMEETVRTFRIELPVVLHVFAESEEDARARVKWLFEELRGFGTNLDRVEFLDVGEAPKPIDWRGSGSKGT